MRCEETGRGTFRVWGTQGEPHEVDTLKNRGAGECDCWHWRTDVAKKIEEARRDKTFDPADPRFKCPHIEVADRALLAMFKTQLIKQFGDSDNQI